MNVPIIMPQMGQSVAEGTIVRWRKKTGEAIATDEVIAEIESDKISIEVESPVAGTLGSCLKREGDTAAVGEIIGMIIAEGASPSADPSEPLPSASSGQNRPHAAVAGDQILVSTRTASHMPANLNLPDITSAWLSPYVLRLAVQNNISMHELQSIRGTGRQGRLTRNDILQYLARRPVSSYTLPGAGDPEHADLTSLGQVVPMTSIRRTIADHMVQSIRTSAHVTMVHAVDMTYVVALREQYKEAFALKHGVKMTYTAVILFVTARVLREYPIINASVSGANIVMRKDVNIGCAVALQDESLVVPVVKNADQKTFPEIAQDLERLISLARGKALRREDIEGGTFSLSNFGAFGSLIGTPIINQPQVAILGMGAVFKAPVVVDNQICIRDQVYLSFTFDHRVIDGAMGGRFLNAIQKQTEAVTAETLGLKAV